MKMFYTKILATMLLSFSVFATEYVIPRIDGGYIYSDGTVVTPRIDGGYIIDRSVYTIPWAEGNHVINRGFEVQSEHIPSPLPDEGLGFDNIWD